MSVPTMPKTKASQTKINSDHRILAIVGLVAIVTATVFAYSNVLFNFFNGDDFVHLVWLKDAVKNHELIWRNFHSSWLDGTTTRFYRPLISVFMLTDYLTSGINGFGFHLTNLLFHLASTLLIFFIVKDLAMPAQQKNQNINATAWALMASAIFGLYPLHPEAVSWITGRVDSVVTPFCLFSFLTYMYWRRSGKLVFAALSTISLWLGLFSKEMTITTPAVFVLWEIFYGTKQYSDSAIGWSVGKLKSIIVHTSWFWLMLAVYFVVRVNALGTFVGGYDDSLLYIANWSKFIGDWTHGLKRLFVPVNTSLISIHHPMATLWQVSTIGSAVLALIGIATNRQLLRPVGFLAIWFVFCLAPVYKIFAITDDLQGSRLAYLATVPLCALMTAAFAVWSKNKSAFPKNVIQVILAGLFAVTAASLLWTNNQAWAQAGQEANAIRKSLDALYRQIPGDPQTVFIGLPDEVHGSYVTRNALWGMTKTPQMHRDIFNCLMVNGFEPIQPFGYWKESLYEGRENLKLFRWAGTDKGFLEITLPQPEELKAVTRTWQGNTLKQILKPEAVAGAEYIWNADGSLTLKSTATARKHPEIIVDLGQLPCWFVNFIAVNVEPVNAPLGSGVMAIGGDLLYTNNIKEEFELRRRTHAEVTRQMIFPLHGLPEWALGGTSGNFKLRFQPGTELTIKSISIVPPENVMPAITFNNSGFFGTKGYLHLSPKDNKQTITVDTRNIANAASAQVEVTRPNLLFENQNTTESSRVIAKTIKTGKTSTVTLTKEQFPAAGLYELRVRALDASLNPVGVASDHIVLSVD